MDPQHVDAIRAELDRGALDRALSLALRRWRQTLAPPVADLVERLDRRVSYEGPRARTRAAFQARWLALADAEPDDDRVTGWLAAELATKLPVEEDHYGSLTSGYAARKYAALHARLARLADRPADPRIASALVALL